MDRNNGTRTLTSRLTPANGNGPHPEQYNAANNFAGELLSDINRERTAWNVPTDLVREVLFFSLIPNLMDDSCGAWSAEKLTEAVRRAAVSWAGIRGEYELKDHAGHLG